MEILQYSTCVNVLSTEFHCLTQQNDLLSVSSYIACYSDVYQKLFCPVCV